MIERASYDLLRFALRLVVQLWPLWLFWFAWDLSGAWWRDYLLTFSDTATAGYAFAYRCWPSVALLGPILLMLLAIGAHRLHLANRIMPIAGIAGVLAATILTAWPEYRALTPSIGSASLLDIVSALDVGIVQAIAVGLAAGIMGTGLVRQRRVGGKSGPRVVRGRSDNFGHADWLAMREARRLFPGPDETFGGIVVGESYRVDQDRVARRAFDPANRNTWGQGGTTPLLIDPCRTGSTHALVFGGPGGFKTTSVGVPTMLTWRGAAVVLDPSREIAPMVEGFRQTQLGHRVVTLDPADPGGGAFNVLDWIDIATPEAETNIEAVVAWICGEIRGQSSAGAEFFRESGKGLIACLLANMLWDPKLGPERKTLKHLRRALVTPEDDMRALLARIHASSASPLARDLAGTLKGLVAETFSGVYGNASKDTRWLSTAAYADLVSGNSFRTRDLADGQLTVFVQVPLKTLQATPALGRVIVGALLNAAYEADGRVQGRILFLLDEVARLSYMGVLEQARDAGRKYGITLLLLYQSLGQLVGQWGRDGKQAWYDATSWRLFAAVQDPDTARELSAMCGEYGVVATTQGNSSGSQGRGSGIASSSSGRSENRSEIRRALIKPEEIVQDTRADEAFVLVRGAKPLRCGRAIYFRRPDMAPLVAANRFPPARTPPSDRRRSAPLAGHRTGGNRRMDTARGVCRQHFSRLCGCRGLAIVACRRRRADASAWHTARRATGPAGTGHARRSTGPAAAVTRPDHGRIGRYDRPCRREGRNRQAGGRAAGRARARPARASSVRALAALRLPRQSRHRQDHRRPADGRNPARARLPPPRTHGRGRPLHPGRRLCRPHRRPRARDRHQGLGRRAVHR
jgi:type IV secretion system protein VirD4